MTLQNQKKLANHICRLLKVPDIIIPIGRTSKGNLGLRFSTNQEEYEMYLDAIPLSTKDILNDENNIELKKMLEKYLFEQTQQFIVSTPTVTQIVADVSGVRIEPTKKRGRPAKKK